MCQPQKTYEKIMKRNHGKKEVDQLQRLKSENKTLKRELSQIRKQMARIDLDRFDTLREMIEENQTTEEPEFGANFLDNLKNTWLCNDCRQGHLEIILYNKVDSTWYYRKCSNCPNRTKSQKYFPSVQGIVKKATLDE